MIYWGAVMPTWYDHSTIGAAVRSAPNHTILPERNGSGGPARQSADV